MTLSSDLKVYIAGHSGLVGSAFLRYFQQAGFSNLLTRSHEKLDLTHAETVIDFMSKEKPEIVIMAAGRVGGIIDNREHPADFITENLSMQLNILSSAAKTNVKRLLFFASSCMYPRETKQPMNEKQLCTGQPEPTSIAYATAKYAGLQMCQAYNKQFGEIRFITVIPNSAYGPNDNFNPESAHVLSSLIHRFHDAKEKQLTSVCLWGTGQPKREFIFSDDIANICFSLLSTDFTIDELPVNIGSGVDLSIHDLALKIKTLVGYQGDIKWDLGMPDGAPQKLLDNSRLKRKIGEYAFTDIDRGIEMTYQWFLQNKDRFS